MQKQFEPKLLAKRLIETHGQLATKISRAVFCTLTECELGLTEVIRFLSLAAENSEGTLTPSQRVDLVWHEFILHTKAYQEFCIQHFGKFIHHHPGGDVRENTNRFEQTMKSYCERFGTPPDAWWGSKVANCGSCESNI